MLHLKKPDLVTISTTALVNTNGVVISNREFVLNVTNQPTMRMRSYGPFETMELLEQFAREHRIRIPKEAA